MQSKSLNNLLALLAFLFMALPVTGQITVPGKTTYDKFLSAFWSQNSNASNLVAGVNANAEIPFDNDSITNTFTNKTYQGTLSLTNTPTFRTYDGGSAVWHTWNWQTTNGVPMLSNTVSRVGMTETLSNKTIWTPIITNVSEQWDFNVIASQSSNTVARILNLLTTNNTQAGWLTALGFTEAESQPLTGYGTSGFLSYYFNTNVITNSSFFINSANVGLDGGLRIGSTNGTAGDNNLQVDGYIGVGVAPSTGYGIYHAKAITNYPYNRALYITPTFITTSNLSNPNYGISSVLSASYAMTNATNSSIYIAIDAAGTINNTNHEGNISAMYGLRSQHGILSGPGSIENSYGLRIEGFRTTGTVSSLWGIYEIDNDYNYFESKTGFNTTSPAAQVAINGGLHVGGTSDPGDNNVSVDGHVYVSGTNYANYVMGTNYISSDGTIGCTMSFTNYVYASDYTTKLTNITVIKSGLVTTNYNL